MPGKEGVRRSVGHALFDLAAVRAYLSQAWRAASAWAWARVVRS